MDLNRRIPTEILQKLPGAAAWEYGLVPYRIENDFLFCYADNERSYSGIEEEVELFYNIRIKIEPVDKADVDELLSRHYRKERKQTQDNIFSVPAISTGQSFLRDIISEAYDSNASDIHLESYEDKKRIRLRIDGKLLERYIIEKQNYPALVNQVKIMAGLDISEKRLPQDGRIMFNDRGEKFDLRVSCLPTLHGEKIVLRLLTRQPQLLDLDNLGFDQRQMSDFLWAINKPHGMILICGPTGSGKSTTLYATLRRLNSENTNIVTIEDPVEYTLEGINQVQLKEEIGLSFASALRTFLRQDPDIIMLGEIRDSETAEMAIRSSLTGHLIFSTIHTNSAWACVDRLTDMGVHPYLVSSTLVLCVAQRLVRLLCPHCKKEEPVSREMTLLIGDQCPEIHYRETGCEKCFYTGFSGRQAIYEVIPVTGILKEATRERAKDIDTLLDSEGITSLKNSAIGLFRSGKTSYAEILSIIRGQ